MSAAPDALLARVREAIARFAKRDAKTALAELAGLPEAERAGIDEADATALLQDLLRSRWFDLAVVLGRGLPAQERASPEFRKRYGQALIEQGQLDAARTLLRELMELNPPPSLAHDVLGLLGRTYKQQFVESRKSGRPDGALLDRAIEAYQRGYEADTKANTYHAINMVALLALAEREDQRAGGSRDAQALAATVLKTLRGKESQTPWDVGTEGEAYVALADWERATERLRAYAWDAKITAFNIGSTLRQMEEIWLLEEGPEAAQDILTLLRARLTELRGGTVQFPPDVCRAMRQSVSHPRFEKVFGKNGMVTRSWFAQALERCEGVARIGSTVERGEGTGFMLQGRDLSPRLDAGPIVVTNFHVISPDGSEGLHPDEAVICFHALPGVDPGTAFTVRRVLWASPKTALDVVILECEQALPARASYPIAPTLPTRDSHAPVLVIGHPGGGVLTWSIDDNELLDYEDHRIHYRTPTEGGNSGSPVFNNKWSLIALHHAGDEAMPRLRGAAGTYQANEGIWIKAIQDRLGAEYTPGAARWERSG